MLFSSTLFLFAFLPIVLSLYFLLPGVRARNALLLVASLLFYAWGEPLYVLLLLSSIGLNFTLGRLVRGNPEKNERGVLALAIGLNLGLLAVFKYANFVVENLDWLFALFALPPIELAPIPLPIGISFFTFQAITYVVDIHRGEAEAQVNPGRVGLYIALFPQLIAGPIVRYREIAAALKERTSRLEDVAEGAQRFIIGLAKKVLVADALAVPVDRIFAIPADELTMSVAWLGLIAFSFQIYFDFAGYSDMAIGLGRCFGFRFPENFNWPYTSSSLREFWRRWHITLSSFFRDYLYIPMGGNRLGPTRTAFNLMTVFLLCGLWHGASWTFVIWGLIHGAFLAAERTRFGTWIEASPTFIQRTYVLAVVFLAWTFFRTPDIAHGWDYLTALVQTSPPLSQAFPLALYLDTHLMTVLAIACLSLTKVPERLWQSTRTWPAKADVSLEWTRSVTLLLTLALCAMSISASTHNPFIYFRF
jgi:alginate O-acetyltransferase complex protein AlgI